MDPYNNNYSSNLMDHNLTALMEGLDSTVRQFTRLFLLKVGEACTIRTETVNWI